MNFLLFKGTPQLIDGNTYKVSSKFHAHLNSAGTTKVHEERTDLPIIGLTAAGPGVSVGRPEGDEVTGLGLAPASNLQYSKPLYKSLCWAKNHITPISHPSPL